MTAIDSNAPTATKLEEAIAQLGRWYGIISSNEFMAKLLGFSAATYESSGNSALEASASADIIKKAATDSKDPLSYLASAVTGLTDGGTLIYEFNDMVASFISNAGEDVAVKDAIEGGSSTGDRLFTVTYEKDAAKKFVCTDTDIKDLLPVNSADNINNNTKKPSNQHPSLGIIQFHSAAMGFANRYSGAVSVFMSALPTIEISRCVPYLDVRLITNQPTVNSDGSIGDGISLFRFLNGNSKIDNEWAEWMKGNPVDEAVPTLYGTQEEMADKTISGMELFTAPQTLNNGDEPYYDIGPPIATEAGALVRTTSVIDKFRPFMTLLDFSIKVLPSTGTLSSKTADCSFVLHDRSRLHEITQLVTPGGLIDIDLQVEYGWSHPDPNSPYGALLNAMRSKEKFGVMNSSYSFDPDGQVKVSLKLYSKGSKDTAYSLITDAEVKNSMDALRDAVKALGDMKRKMKSMGFQSLSEIVDGGDILGKTNSVSSILSLNAEDLKKLKEVVAKIAAQGARSGGVMEELGDALSTAVNGDGSGGGGLESYKSAVERATAEQLKFISDGNDPFLKNCKSGGYINVERDRTPPNVKHVSFAKIATNFIGGPIASTGKFAEVQMIFYPLNEYASFARDNDTGSFPIELGYFKKAILEKMQASPTFTIGQFIGFMNRNFFSNGASDAFGFGDIFTRDEKNGKAVLLKKFTGDKKAAKEMKLKLPQMKEDVLKAAYNDPAAAARFKKPGLAIYIESVPSKKDARKTICRIHFFDRNATSYAGFAEMWNSIKNNSFGIINKELHGASKTIDGGTGDAQRDTGSNYQGLFQQQLKVLESLKIVEQVPVKATRSASTNEAINADWGKSYFRIAGGPAGLRYMFTKFMPTIKFGTEYSAVLNASLSTNSNPQMQVIHMKRQQKRSGDSPPQSMDDGLPLRVFPTKLSMDTFGCPMLNFGQQFFVDFQTGTTADDVYIVNSVTHKLSPSEFKTSFEMVPLNKAGQFNSLVENLTKAVKASDAMADALGQTFPIQ